MLLKLKKILINLKEKSDILDDDVYYIEKNLYEELLLKINKMNNNHIKEEKTNFDDLFLLYRYLNNKKNYKKALNNNLNYIKFLKLPKKSKKENIQKLYGNKIMTSVSKNKRKKRIKNSKYRYRFIYA